MIAHNLLRTGVLSGSSASEAPSNLRRGVRCWLSLQEQPCCSACPRGPAPPQQATECIQQGPVMQFLDMVRKGWLADLHQLCRGAGHGPAAGMRRRVPAVLSKSHPKCARTPRCTHCIHSENISFRKFSDWPSGAFHRARSRSRAFQLHKTNTAPRRHGGGHRVTPVSGKRTLR